MEIRERPTATSHTFSELFGRRRRAFGRAGRTPRGRRAAYRETMASLPEITIGIDAATRAKLQNNLVAQLSFFSITQTDDPIPRTNFTFSVYYVLGALAALLYALLDPSCEELTAYRRSAPIDECTGMLATFTCRTADYDRTTGAGFTRTFDAFTCLDGKNYTEEIFGAYPPSVRATIKEAAFPCRTADYDANTGTGFERSFSPLACPSRDDTANIPVYSDANPPATCTAIQETTFKCRAADYDATTAPVTGWEQEFTVATCPTGGSGTGSNVFGWHDVSECGNLVDDPMNRRRTSKRGSNVQGSVEGNDGGGVDVSYGGAVGVSPHASCQACVTCADVYECRNLFAQCCGLDADILALSLRQFERDDPRSGSERCPAGSASSSRFRCVATGETACPASVQTSPWRRPTAPTPSRSPITPPAGRRAGRRTTRARPRGTRAATHSLPSPAPSKPTVRTPPAFLTTGTRSAGARAPPLR